MTLIYTNSWGGRNTSILPICCGGVIQIVALVVAVLLAGSHPAQAHECVSGAVETSKFTCACGSGLLGSGQVYPSSGCYAGPHSCFPECSLCTSEVVPCYSLTFTGGVSIQLDPSTQEDMDATSPDQAIVWNSIDGSLSIPSVFNSSYGEWRISMDSVDACDSAFSSFGARNMVLSFVWTDDTAVDVYPAGVNFVAQNGSSWLSGSSVYDSLVFEGSDVASNRSVSITLLQGVCDGEGQGPTCCDVDNNCTFALPVNTSFSWYDPESDTVLEDPGDDEVFPVMLPFHVKFGCDQSSDVVYISTNGYIMLSVADPFPDHENTAQLAVGQVAVFWDDLDPSVPLRSGTISWGLRNSSEDRLLVVTYSKIAPFLEPGRKYSFQVVLSERGDSLWMNYETVEWPTSGSDMGMSATVGVRTAAGTSLYSYDDAVLSNGMTLKWSLPIALTTAPSLAPTDAPSTAPTLAPSTAPTDTPTDTPTNAPTGSPTLQPTHSPSGQPTPLPTPIPTPVPIAPPPFTVDVRLRITNFSLDSLPVGSDARRDFESALLEDLSSALGVPMSTLIVVQLLRGSIIAQVRFLGDGSETATAVAAELWTLVQNTTSSIYTSNRTVTSKVDPSFFTMVLPSPSPSPTNSNNSSGASVTAISLYGAGAGVIAVIIGVVAFAVCSRRRQAGNADQENQESIQLRKQAPPTTTPGYSSSQLLPAASSVSGQFSNLSAMGGAASSSQLFPIPSSVSGQFSNLSALNARSGAASSSQLFAVSSSVSGQFSNLSALNMRNGGPASNETLVPSAFQHISEKDTPGEAESHAASVDDAASAVSAISWPKLPADFGLHGSSRMASSVALDRVGSSSSLASPRQARSPPVVRVAVQRELDNVVDAAEERQARKPWVAAHARALQVLSSRTGKQNNRVRVDAPPVRQGSFRTPLSDDSGDARSGMSSHHSLRSDMVEPDPYFFPELADASSAAVSPIASYRSRPGNGTSATLGEEEPDPQPVRYIPESELYDLRDAMVERRMHVRPPASAQSNRAASRASSVESWPPFAEQDGMQREQASDTPRVGNFTSRLGPSSRARFKHTPDQFHQFQ